MTDLTKQKIYDTIYYVISKYDIDSSQLELRRACAHIAEEIYLLTNPQNKV